LAFCDIKSRNFQLIPALRQAHVVRSYCIKSTEEYNEYSTNFDKGTFSRAVTVKPNDFEERIYNELSNCLILDIKYYCNLSKL
jgi:hypothetical protein